MTWLSIPAAGVPWGLTMALLLGADTAGDPEMAAEGPMLVHGMVLVLTPVLAVVLAVPAVICWSVGHSARRRRDRRHAQEEGGVALALEQAAFRAMLERHRIAAGLHEAVLRHAADVPGAAERGDISGVLAAARKALTAMRSLLDREVSKSASSE